MHHQPALEHERSCSHERTTWPERGRGARPGGELAEGALFARYRIERCVGRGGMGAVYQATHAVLNKPVALKLLHRASIDDPAALERFHREAQIAARVRHAHVVDIYDAGVEGGVPFLVMELLEGEDLAKRLRREGRLLAQEAVDAVLPALTGLAELHRLGIVHGDVKPENLFLALDAHGDVAVKLIDFGVSKRLGNECTRLDAEFDAAHISAPARRTLEGTPHYMAPEQMRGEAAFEPRIDQYALGVVLYECLAGRRPYEGGSLLELAYHVCGGEHESLGVLRPDLPPELRAIVSRAMALEVEDRFACMEELGEALLPFASEERRPEFERVLWRARRASQAPGASRPSCPPPRRESAPALAALGSARTLREGYKPGALRNQALRFVVPLVATVALWATVCSALAP